MADLETFICNFVDFIDVMESCLLLSPLFGRPEGFGLSASSPAQSSPSRLPPGYPDSMHFICSSDTSDPLLNAVFKTRN